MKARLPVTKKVKSSVRKCVAEELDRQEKQRTRRIYKLLCAALNRRYGFGKSRLLVTISDISSLAVQHDEDEIFWAHIDRLVIDQIGMPFDREESE